MATELATRIPAQLPEAVEQALVQGDLAKLTPTDRVKLYLEVCGSLGLNPLTVPFQYITLNNRLVLYALKSCTDQLRFLHSVNVEIVSRERIDDIYVVTTRARLPNGRTDEEIGAVPIAGLKGEQLANALMKASTKAKRRVTLAIVGLSMLDETEIETIRDARRPTFQIEADRATGEIIEQRALSEAPPARSYDGKSIRPPVKHSPQLEPSGSSTTSEKPKEEADELAVDRAERERLMDGWASIWNRAQQLGIETPPSDVSGLTNAQLAKAGADLKVKVNAELDRREAAKGGQR